MLKKLILDQQLAKFQIKSKRRRVKESKVHHLVVVIVVVKVKRNKLRNLNKREQSKKQSVYKKLNQL